MNDWLRGYSRLYEHSQFLGTAFGGEPSLQLHFPITKYQPYTQWRIL